VGIPTLVKKPDFSKFVRQFSHVRFENKNNKYLNNFLGGKLLLLTTKKILWQIKKLEYL